MGVFHQKVNLGDLLLSFQRFRNAFLVDVELVLALMNVSFWLYLDNTCITIISDERRHVAEGNLRQAADR